MVVNLDVFNRFSEGQEVTAEMLAGKGIIEGTGPVKVLGNGTLKKKISFKGFEFSASAKDKIAKAGGSIAQ